MSRFYIPFLRGISHFGDSECSEEPMSIFLPSLEGGFLLANIRFTPQPGYVGRLHGPLLPGNHKYCLRFYYLLHGYRKVDSALFLYIYDENNVAQEKVWSLTHAARAVWTEVEIAYRKPMLTKV